MRIFISYAREDTGQAHALYLALKERGHEPWMDKPPPPYQLDGLKPGENWRLALEREIGAADRMLMLLSKNSVEKAGYVQREFRLALDRMNEMPMEAQFAIPLLLDDCEVPELVVGQIRLADLHWTILAGLGVELFIDALENEQ